jgi:hypothetical protein
MVRFPRWMGFVAAAGLLLGLLALCSPRSPGQAALAVNPGVVWEYKTLALAPIQQPDEALSELGQEGWELVAVSDRTQSMFYVFKRPKQR